MRRTHVVLASIVAVVLAATAAEAQNVVQGTALAVDEINKAGGFPVGDKTYTLQLIALDTRGEPKEAFVQLKRLVEVDGVKYIFGPFLSNVFLAIRPSKRPSSTARSSWRATRVSLGFLHWLLSISPTGSDRDPCLTCPVSPDRSGTARPRSRR
jgi:hypothetical protein